MDDNEKSSALLKILGSGIDAVRPNVLFPALIDHPAFPELEKWIGADQKFLLCLGKAAISSAKSILQRLQVADYFILSPYPAEVPLKIHLGSHPIPDENSLASAGLLNEWISSLPETAELLIILSGGSSALLFSPQQGLQPAAKMEINRLLIRSGATIQEINTVRKHLSSVKGGQMAQKIGKRNAFVLVISDVPGNDLSSIGSGPFYPDSSSYSDAIQILQRYGLWEEAGENVRTVLEEGIGGLRPETPKPGSFTIPHYIIASNETAQEAAARRAVEGGYEVSRLSSLLTGGIEEAAETILNAIRQGREGTAWILGGEVTIRVKGSGTGGRNQHLALLLTRSLADTRSAFVAAGTDGIDGNSNAAGAWTDGRTFGRSLGIESWTRAVQEFDSFEYFRSIGQNVITGPTGTNVMDLYIALV